jgi:hypothetical protein
MTELSIGPYGARDLEVIQDGVSIAVFRTRRTIETDRATGRGVEAPPTAEDWAEAQTRADLFVRSLKEDGSE